MQSIRGLNSSFSVWLLALLCFQAASTGLSQQSAYTKKPVTQHTRMEHEAFWEIYALARAWVGTNDQAAGRLCQEKLSKLVADPEHSVEVDFTAAKVAMLADKPTTAFNILAQAVVNRPAEKAPGMNLSVAIAARMWMGAIARGQGDVVTAKRIYTETLAIKENPKFDGILHAVGRLYLAEIECHQLQRNDRAIEHLTAIGKIARPPGRNEQLMHEIYTGWAKYERERLTNGNQAARKTRESGLHHSKVFPLFVEAHLALAGVTGEPRAGFSEIMNLRERPLQLALTGKRSPIDRDLAIASLGAMAATRRDWTNAEKHFSELFHSNSFLAPEAGFRLAQCQSAQSKKSQTQATLSEISTQFPAYAPVVAAWAERELKRQ